MTSARLLLAIALLALTQSAPTRAAAAAPPCREQLIRYCISLYASWDMPPTLANCVAAMEPGPGTTPAWYTLRPEIASGTIPPLAAYQRCLAGTRPGALTPRPRP